jgi:single-strand DNA-binding protein
MTLIGRITKDALIQQLPDGRNVVHFSIALNEQYKTKAGERVKHTTYVDCTYWKSTKITPYLTKGSLIEVAGFLSVAPYLGSDGTAKASLNCQVHQFTLLAKGKQSNMVPSDPVVTEESVDDLPF